MDGLRKLVAMLGALAGILGIALALVVLDWITLSPALSPDLSAAPNAVSPPASGGASGGLRAVAILGGVICIVAALALRRAPRVAAAGLVAGSAALYVGLGYTAFTMLPIGFAAIAALLAVVLAFSDAP